MSNINYSFLLIHFLSVAQQIPPLLHGASSPTVKQTDSKVRTQETSKLQMLNGLDLCAAFLCDPNGLKVFYMTPVWKGQGSNIRVKFQEENTVTLKVIARRLQLIAALFPTLRHTSKHCSGLFDRLRDVPHAADLWPICVWAGQGGHGLDGAQVVF